VHKKPEDIVDQSVEASNLFRIMYHGALQVICTVFYIIEHKSYWYFDILQRQYSSRSLPNLACGYYSTTPAYSPHSLLCYSKFPVVHVDNGIHHILYQTIFFWQMLNVFVTHITVAY